MHIGSIYQFQKTYGIIRMYHVRFQAFMVMCVCVKMCVSWDVALCGLVDTD